MSITESGNCQKGKDIMSKKYVHPPIVEAVCEFRITSESKWDLTIPGLVYEKVRKEFPKKEQRLIRRIEATQIPKENKQRVSTEERILFLTNNRKMFIQMGSRLLAVNCLKPYPTWNGFKPEIENAFGALCGIVDIKGLQRIGLRYINRIEIPGTLVNLDDYFAFRPFIGRNLPQVLENFIVGSVFPSSDEQDACKVQLTNATCEKPGHSAFLLDLDYFLSQPQPLPANKASEWIETAHHQIENIFEGCITDRLRKIFGR